MQLLFSKLTIALVLIPLSRMPFSLLLKLSDLLFFLVYYLFPYRKKVVLSNLKNSFPEKSEKERVKIARDFYRHFCDLFVETIKTPGLKRTEALSRLVVENPEVVDELYDKNRNVIVMAGHYHNWEWAATLIPAFVRHRCVGIFNPFKNKTFHYYITKSRARFGMNLVPKNEFYSEIEPIEGQQPKAVFFLSDQVPKNPYKTFWTEFLNQETGFPYGAGAYAVKYNYAVVYAQINKKKRGYYSIKLEILEENPTDRSPEEILKKYSELLEAQILENPQYWLWTHKRWKRSKPADYDEKKGRR